jgi:hypothetical protein
VVVLFDPSQQDQNTTPIATPGHWLVHRRYIEMIESNRFADNALRFVFF